MQLISNKGLIAGLIKENQWFSQALIIRPYFWRRQGTTWIFVFVGYLFRILPCGKSQFFTTILFFFQTPSANLRFTIGNGTHNYTFPFQKLFVLSLQLV